LKSRILLLVLLAFAGFGASYALADTGHGHGESTSTRTTGTSPCQRVHVLGTVAAPQSFTLTITHSGGENAAASGKVVTVKLGSAGQTVNVNVEGCLTGSSVVANQAELHVQGKHGDQGEHHMTTTSSTTTIEHHQTATTATTTTTGHDQGEHHQTTTSSTTTGH
jgi:hypothetical protein